MDGSVDDGDKECGGEIEACEKINNIHIIFILHKMGNGPSFLDFNLCKLSRENNFFLFHIMISSLG